MWKRRLAKRALQLQVSCEACLPGGSVLTRWCIGFKLAGAVWKDEKLSLNDGQSVPLGPSHLTWRQKDLAEKIRGAQSVNLPVYLNGDRSDVLFSVDLETNGLTRDVVSQRGVCLTAG